MKIVHPIILGAALVIGAAARADVPFDAGKFGHMKAVLDVCGRFAPQQASGYLLEMKSLIADASKATVAEATKTDDYQQAYQAAQSELSTLEPEARASACRDSLAAAKSAAADRSRGGPASAKSSPSGGTATPSGAKMTTSSDDTMTPSGGTGGTATPSDDTTTPSDDTAPASGTTTQPGTTNQAGGTTGSEQAPATFGEPPTFDTR